MEDQTRQPPHLAAPSLDELFWNFLRLSVSAFGGVMPLIHRAVVEDKKWLTQAEFTEIYGMAQLLPGPNIINLAIGLGARYHGPKGAMTAVAGLTIVPIFIILVLALCYDHFGNNPLVRLILNGVTPAAAGLMIAMAVKMALPLFKARSARALGFMAGTFAVIVWLKVSLVWVFVVLLPIHIALVAQDRKRARS